MMLLTIYCTIVHVDLSFIMSGGSNSRCCSTDVLVQVCLELNESSHRADLYFSGCGVLSFFGSAI